MTKPSFILFVVLTGAISATATAQIVSQDFNTPGTFATDFNQNGAAPGNFFQQTVGGGLSGSLAIDLTNQTADATAIFRNTTFDVSALTATDSITISSYFRVKASQAGANAGAIFQIGLASTAGDGANTNGTGTSFNNSLTPIAANNDFLTGRVASNGGLQFQSSVNGLNSTGGGTGPDNTPAAAVANTLTVGNFYFLTLTLNRLAALNSFSGSISLFNSDTAGVLGSQIGTTLTSPLTNSEFYNSTAAFVGFRASGTSGGPILYGTDLIDNFSALVVPEPGTAVLGGLGMLGLLARRRRRA